jgi:hypothetical protein
MRALIEYVDKFPCLRDLRLETIFNEAGGGNGLLIARGNRRGLQTMRSWP